MSVGTDEADIEPWIDVLQVGLATFAPEPDPADTLRPRVRKLTAATGGRPSRR